MRPGRFYFRGPICKSRQRETERAERRLARRMALRIVTSRNRQGTASLRVWGEANQGLFWPADGHQGRQDVSSENNIIEI